MVIGHQDCISLDVMARTQVERIISHAAYKFAKTRQELLKEASESLEKANIHMKKILIRKEGHYKFQVGDRVMLKLTPHICKKTKGKHFQRGLIPKYDGPFKIEKKIGVVA